MATRYWVGGTGNWTDTAHWSDTSGGSSGFSAPVVGDSVYFDSSSGGGTVTFDSATVVAYDASNFTGTFTTSLSFVNFDGALFKAGIYATYSIPGTTYVYLRGTGGTGGALDIYGQSAVLPGRWDVRCVASMNGGLSFSGTLHIPSSGHSLTTNNNTLVATTFDLGFGAVLYPGTSSLNFGSWSSCLGTISGTAANVTLTATGNTDLVIGANTIASATYNGTGTLTVDGSGGTITTLTTTASPLITWRGTLTVTAPNIPAATNFAGSSLTSLAFGADVVLRGASVDRMTIGGTAYLYVVNGRSIGTNSGNIIFCSTSALPFF